MPKHNTFHISPALQLPPLGRQAELVYDSLVEQTRDTLAQTGLSEFVLGLSGGLDSALVATIAVDALALVDIESHRVHGIIMPSQWTSQQSLDDAQELAKRLKIQSNIFDIMPTYLAINDTLAPAFVGRNKDVTEENIQARIRAVFLMALSNKFDWLVLSTSNLSELSVGYTTLYGDMVGAFAPLAPLYKTWVYELAYFRNERASSLGLELPIPRSILEKEPSAELAPNQTDRAALGSYGELDALLYALQEGNKDLLELKQLGFDSGYVDEIARKVKSSEFKRLQAAPGAVLPLTVE